MKLRITVVSKALFPTLALLAAMVVPPSGYAQTYDHLKCFRVKDPGTFASATMDLEDVLFGLTAGCEIKKKAKEFCIPVDKTVTAIEGGSDTPLLGQDQTFDRLCYKLKCPVSPTGTANFSDQFGTRGHDKHSLIAIVPP